MATYLKYFETEAEYNAFITSDNFVLPNVSYAVDTDTVFYHVVKTESGDYKIYLLSPGVPTGITYNMVDLGLESGTLWADRNVGASTAEDFGTYFAWGETTGYNCSVKYCTAAELCDYMQPFVGEDQTLTEDNIDAFLEESGVTNKDITSIGTGFATATCFSSNFSDYSYTTDGGSTFTKYNLTDGLTTLESTDDAAYVNMGSNYRMPTQTEFEELVDNTTITFIDLDNNEYTQSEAQNSAIAEFNLKCVKFTGANGNSIIVPASGGAYDSALSDASCGGYLWSSSLNSSDVKYACGMYFNCDGYVLYSYASDRCFGLPVRGVQG